MKDWLRGFIGGFVVAMIIANISYLIVSLMYDDVIYWHVILLMAIIYVVYALLLSMTEGGKNYFKSFPKFRE